MSVSASLRQGVAMHLTHFASCDCGWFTTRPDDAEARSAAIAHKALHALRAARVLPALQGIEHPRVWA